MWVLMCSMSEWLVVQYCVICVCQRSFSIFQGHDFYFMKQPKIEVNELMMITRTISTWCAQKFIHWLKLTKRNDNYPWNSIMEKIDNTKHEKCLSIVFPQRFFNCGFLKSVNPLCVWVAFSFQNVCTQRKQHLHKVNTYHTKIHEKTFFECMNLSCLWPRP